MWSIIAIIYLTKIDNEHTFQQMKRFVKCMILARYSLDDNVELSEIATKVS